MARQSEYPNWTPALLRKARAIRLVVFDIDGVMTDGRLYRDDDGKEIKAFHSRDGLGLKGLMGHGFTLAAVTARSSSLVDTRMAELGIEYLHQGRHDKGSALQELLQQTGLTTQQTAYMGDDLVDWPAMSQAAVRICPADADPWIRDQADYATLAPGGRGAVREACEMLLAAQNLLRSWRASFGAHDTASGDVEGNRKT